MLNLRILMTAPDKVMNITDMYFFLNMLNMRILMTGPDKVRNITDMYTDSFFSYGVHSFLNSHLKHAR
jgi:hypothetical protein